MKYLMHNFVVQSVFIFIACVLIGEGKPIEDLIEHPTVVAVSNSTIKENDTLSSVNGLFNAVNANKSQSVKNPRCKFAIPGLSCMNGDIQFFLQTSENPTEQKLESPFTSFNGAKFIPQAPIKVIIHGLNETRNDPLMSALVQELLKKNGGMNVITVDYSTLATANCYLMSVKSAPVIAKCLAELIDAIVFAHKEISLKDFHIIGFSIGAQIAGQMSAYKKTPSPYTRITGIDPAAPGFVSSKFTSSMVLDPSDASFVDVIHGNSGILGKLFPVGHVDFFPNSGIFQGGCPANRVDCSHYRAVLLYIESINELITLKANKCPYIESFYVAGCNDEELITFGDNSNTQMRGIYFFKTNSKAPYIGTEKLDQYEVFQEQEELANLAESQGLV